MWHIDKSDVLFRAYTIYALVTLLVMTPLLGRGYILSLDMVFTPKLRMPTSVTNDYLFRALLHGLNYIIPADVIEKFILISILMLASIGASRLLRIISPQSRSDKIGIIFASILYMLNPFTYDRFMAGQYEVLLGYAIIPWFASALLSFLSNPGSKNAIPLICWSLAVSIVSIHTVGIIALITVVATADFMISNRNNGEWQKRLVQFGTLAAIVFIVLSSYWLIPLVINHGPIASAVSSFSSSDQQAFATVGHGWLGKFGNAMQLQGFWAEPLGLYKLPQTNLPSWLIITAMVWLVNFIGIVSYWRSNQRPLLVIFGICSIVSIILVIGLFNTWLMTHIPYFRGYREPEKLLAILCLTFAILSARGIASIIKYTNEQGGKIFLGIAIFLIFLLPIVWTHTMLWGFNGQLATSFYPTDWFKINRRLDSDTSNFQTLFLPWHLYMYFGFAGRDIASPAPKFFDKPMVISNNPEFRGVAPSKPGLSNHQFNNLLAHANNLATLGNELAQLNIKYILLAKDDDFLRYGYLDKQPGLTLISDSATLKLYRNNDWK